MSRSRSLWTSARRSKATTGPNPKVLFVFLDGVGIGGDDPAENPFVGARMPALTEMVGGRLPTLERATLVGPQGAAFPLDAGLGVAGTPQSGTGQTALLTGLDAASLHGGHFGPWIPVRLRPLVESESLLRRAADAGRTVAFANAYPRGWPGPGGSRRTAGPPLAARGAAVLDRHEESLAAGDAVSSEIVNDGWRRRLGHVEVPDVTPEGAGRNLARIASRHDLTLYAHYATDTVGHRGDIRESRAALERVDAFLGGILAALPTGALLFVASDHGNIEDVRAGHTPNPALGAASGPGAREATALSDIREVADFLLGRLGVSPP